MESETNAHETVAAGPIDCALEVEVEADEAASNHNSTHDTEAVDFPTEVELSVKDEEESKAANGEDDPNTIIIVFEGNGELSSSTVEAIKQQLANGNHPLVIEEAQSSDNQGDVPVPEPGSFEEQVVAQSAAEHEIHTRDVRTCYQCQATFDSSDDLVYHFVQEHSQSVKCQHCELVFPSIAAATQHKKQRHIELFCTMCNKLYNGTIALRNHVKLRHAKGTKCGTCYKFFDSREEMESHIEVEHKVHKCYFCGSGFYFQTSLQNHVESKHGVSTLDGNLSLDTVSAVDPSTSQQQQTVQLSDIFPRSDVIASAEPIPPNKPHTPRTDAPSLTEVATVPSVETNGPIKVNGPDLEYSPLRRKSTRKRTPTAASLNDDSPAQNKKLAASESSPSNDSSTQNKQAAERDTKETAFICKHCGDIFPHAPLMYSRHLAENHHEFLCHPCSTEFKNKRGFMAHMKIKHDVSTPASQTPSPQPLDVSPAASDALACPYCHERFRTKRTLDVHSKERWKRCPEASACQLCPQVFGTARELVCHQRKEHKGKVKTK